MRYVLSFFTLLLLVVLLLAVVLYLLYRQGEGWLASLVLVSIAFTVLRVYLGNQLTKYREPNLQPSQKSIHPAELLGIYMAAQDIPRGTVLYDHMIFEAGFPRDLIVESYMLNSDRIIDRETRYDIRRGTIIINGLLIELQPVPTPTTLSTPSQ